MAEKLISEYEGGLKGWLEAQIPSMTTVLGGDVKARKFLGATHAAMLDALDDPMNLLAGKSARSLRRCAQTTLMPGQYIHLFARRLNRHSKWYFLDWTMDYHGIEHILRSQNLVVSIRTEVWTDKDDFAAKWNFVKDAGMVLQLYHNMSAEDGKVMGAYCHIVANDGEAKECRDIFERMYLEELEEVRKCSRDANAGPWKSFPRPMYRKAVFRRTSRHVKMDDTAQAALAADDEQSFSDPNEEADAPAQIMASRSAAKPRGGFAHPAKKTQAQPKDDPPQDEADGSGLQYNNETEHELI